MCPCHPKGKDISNRFECKHTWRSKAGCKMSGNFRLRSRNSVKVMWPSYINRMLVNAFGFRFKHDEPRRLWFPALRDECSTWNAGSVFLRSAATLWCDRREDHRSVNHVDQFFGLFLVNSSTAIFVKTIECEPQYIVLQERGSVCGELKISKKICVTYSAKNTIISQHAHILAEVDLVWAIAIHHLKYFLCESWRSYF